MENQAEEASDDVRSSSQPSADSYEALSLIPKKVYKRSEIHDSIMGQRYGTISTPSALQSILLFSMNNNNGLTTTTAPSSLAPTTIEEEAHESQKRPEQTEAHSSETWKFLGEGQGDMSFIRGNRELRDHKTNGKRVLYFVNHKSPGACTYECEVEVLSSEEKPLLNGEGKERKCIEFTLRRVSSEPIELKFRKPAARPSKRGNSDSEDQEPATPAKKLRLKRKQYTEAFAQSKQQSVNFRTIPLLDNVGYVPQTVAAPKIQSQNPISTLRMVPTSAQRETVTNMSLQTRISQKLPPLVATPSQQDALVAMRSASRSPTPVPGPHAAPYFDIPHQQHAPAPLYVAPGPFQAKPTAPVRLVTTPNMVQTSMIMSKNLLAPPPPIPINNFHHQQIPPSPVHEFQRLQPLGMGFVPTSTSSQALQQMYTTFNPNVQPPPAAQEPFL